MGRTVARSRMSGRAQFDPRRSVLGHLLDQIGTRIVRGDIAPGAVLPAEAALMVEFGASRTAVREAVKVLTGKGLLESRQKMGTRVLPRGHWNLLDPEVLSWQLATLPPKGFVDELHEMRLIFEPAAAALAALRASPEQRAELDAICRRMETAGDSAAFVDADVAFHQAVLLASNNAFMGVLASLIQTALLAYFRLTHQHPEAIMRGIPLHRQVCDAVCAGNATAARIAMHELLGGASTLIEQLLQMTDRFVRSPSA